ITFNAGGATINDGGNSVTFANPVGNSGTGALTKSGGGILTLNGTNRYSGNTTVMQGTLAIGSLSFISNSVAIVVNSGATLDVTANAPIALSAPVAQALSGTGTNNGGLTLPANTSISPATNGVIGTFSVNNGDVTFSGGKY